MDALDAVQIARVVGIASKGSKVVGRERER